MWSCATDDLLRRAFLISRWHNHCITFRNNAIRAIRVCGCDSTTIFSAVRLDFELRHCQWAQYALCACLECSVCFSNVRGHENSERSQRDIRRCFRGAGGKSCAVQAPTAEQVCSLHFLAVQESAPLVLAAPGPTLVRIPTSRTNCLRRWRSNMACSTA